MAVAKSGMWEVLIHWVGRSRRWLVRSVIGVTGIPSGGGSVEKELETVKVGETLLFLRQEGSCETVGEAGGGIGEYAVAVG